MKKPLLRGKKKEIFLSIAEAVFPQNGEFPEGREIINPDSVSRYFGYAENDLRIGFLILLSIVNSLSPFLAGKGLKKFTSLSVEERIEVLEKLESSSNSTLRYLVLTLKTLFSLFYYDTPEIWKIVGFDGECLKREEK